MAWTSGIAVLLWLAAGAQEPQRPPEERATRGGILNDVSLLDLTAHVQKVTGKTFTWAEETGLRTRRAHYMTDRAIGDDPALLFEAYRLILRSNRLILVPVGSEEGGAYRIAPVEAGPKEPVPVVRGAPDPSERFVTRVFALQHASPRNLQGPLLALVSFPQNVVCVEEAGVVIITDYESNLARLEEVIRAIDVKRPDLEMRGVSLKNASAAKVEEKMKALLSTLVGRAPAGRAAPGMPGVPGGEAVQVVADERTNSVLLLAEPGRISQLEDLVRRLDAEAPYETGGIHIAPLRHRNALEVAATLNAMYGAAVDPAGATSRGLLPQPAPVPGPAAPPPPSAPALPALAPGGAPVIVPDESTNSLIIVADRTTYRVLEPVIRRLDQRRPQVHIKATVVEISASENFDLGVELNYLPAFKNRFILGARSSVGLTGLRADPATNLFTIEPVLTSGATLLGMKDRVGNIPALLRALEGKAKISILSEPEATTSDNKAATMTESSEVQIPKTTLGTSPGLPGVIGFDALAASTTLTIAPHISEGGYLRLETTVRIEKFTPSPSAGAPPGKAVREISTKEVLVPSGGTMVIGGIVSSDDSSSLEGVPVLSEVPLLGWLFRRETRTRERRTLYIFITPTILYDYAFGDYAELSRTRKEGIERMRGEPVPGLQDGPRTSRLPESTFRFQTLTTARPPAR